MPTEEGTSWKRELYKVVIDGANAAISRARYIFVAMNVTGALLLAAQFNACLPWIRNTLIRARGGPEAELLLKTLYSELAVVSAPVLGVKFSVFDLSLIGPATLTLFALWLYHGLRREYIAVDATLGYSEAALSTDLDAATYLYQGIAHSFVFTATEEDDVLTSRHTQRLVRWAVRVLAFMPVWIPLVIVVVEVITLVVPHALSLDPSTPLWVKLKPAERVEATARLVVAVGLTLVSLTFCWGCYKYNWSTRQRLESIRGAIERGEAERRSNSGLQQTPPSLCSAGAAET
jgi:hypothetical protein